MNLAFTNLSSFAVPLLSGDVGIEQTINLMRQLVDEAKRDARINRQAIEIAKTAPAYDDAAKARAEFDWVLRSIHFVNDPVDKELLRRPIDTITVGAGDCDDITTLICALLESIGLRCRIVTVAVDPSSPGDFSHVYPEVEIYGEWIPVDAARQSATFGMAPTHWFGKLIWDLSSKNYQDLSGIRDRPHPQRMLRGCHCGGKCRKSLSGMGDAASIIAAIGQGVSSVARAADTSNPYASYAGLYTPVSLPAGYTGVSSTTNSSSLFLLALLGLGIFLVVK